MLALLASMDTTRYLQVLASAAASLVVFTGLATAVGVARLDAATAKQCEASNWPAKANDLHRDWCKSNGYAISRISRY